MEENNKKSEKSTRGGRRSPAAPVITVQRRGTPLDRSSGSAKHGGGRVEHDASADSLSSQLTVEEKETNYASPENARRVCSTIAVILEQPNDALRTRASKVVTTWITKGENEWIDAINTPLLFDLTLEMAKVPGVGTSLKAVREKVVKAFLSRLKAARSPAEWLRWLRAALARGDLQSTDVRAHFEPLLQIIVSLVGRTRHAVTVAPRSASYRKLSELWLAHSSVSVEVCNTLIRTPDGLGALCLVHADLVKKQLMPLPSLSSPVAISSPGAFALKVAAASIFGDDSGTGDWFSETAFALSPSDARMSLPEAQAWMDVSAFTIRTVSSKSKVAISISSKSARIIQHVFREYGEAYVREFTTVTERRAAAPDATKTLTDALEALRGFSDFAAVAELILSVWSRSELMEFGAVRDLSLGVCTTLAEVGVQLVVEQSVRFGSLLMTHSWSLYEGDAVEQMVTACLDWIAITPLTKLFLDGRFMLRLAQSCAWPFYCPTVADRCLSLARKFIKAATASGMDVSGVWTKVQSVFVERYGKPIDLTTNPVTSFSPAVSTPAMVFSEARRMYTKVARSHLLIPTFARKEYGLGGGPELTRIARAKRFADAVLVVLMAAKEGAHDWRTDAAEVFWESYLENDASSSTTRRVTIAPGMDEMSDTIVAEKDEQEFRSWLWVWACRGLTTTTLRSRFGTPKDTFQEFESAMERLREQRLEEAVGPGRMLLDLLWSLQREIVVYAPVHPEPRVSGFFQKNAETCQSWLLRLAGFSLKLEERLTFARGAHSIFYFLHYDSNTLLTEQPATWTALVLQTLAKRQATASIRALGCRTELFVSPSSRTWREALELFSKGAYARASYELDRAASLLEEETEGAKKLTDAEKWQMVSIRRFGYEARVRLGQWDRARSVLNAPPVKGGNDDTKFKEAALRFLDAMEACGRDTGVQVDRLDDSTLQALREDPLSSFAKWCTEPSNTTLSSVLRTACGTAVAGGWAEVDELRRFAGGKSGATAQRPSDELWAITEEARKRFKLRPDLQHTARMCLNALEEADTETAMVILRKFSAINPSDKRGEPATETALILDLAKAMRQSKDLPGSAAIVDALFPSGTIGRSLLDIESGKPFLEEHADADLKRVEASSSALVGQYLFALAGLAKRSLRKAQAAELHYRCLQREPNTSPVAQRAFLLYLEETDDQDEKVETDDLASRAQKLADLPCALLKKNLSHLTARSQACRSVAPAMEKVTKEDPRAIVWEIVAVAAEETTPAYAMQLARRAIASAEAGSVLGEAEKLQRALVEASRTFDEDWEDLFEELLKKPWLDRSLNCPASAGAIASRAKQLWDETFGMTEPQSAYHRRFLESDAGVAIASWLHAPSDSAGAKAFHHARTTLGQWITSQGTVRKFGELCGDVQSASESFSVVPGQADALFRMEDHVDVLRTKTRPRKIGFRPIASAGRSPPLSLKGVKHFLLKSAEDLRLDQRLVQLWEMIGAGDARGEVSENVRSYLVIPLSRRVGLVEWVERSVPLFHAYREWKDFTSLARKGENGMLSAGVAHAHGESSSHNNNLEVEKGERLEVTEQFQRALQHTDSKNDRLSAFREVRSGVDQRLLSRFIWMTSRDAESFWSRTSAFATSCGVTSALGWVVGLGDRHLDNVLLEVDSGRVVHVDLNVCFDKGLRLRVPETVPFRLTGVMTGAMPFSVGSSKNALVRGPFGCAMARAMEEIRMKKEEILAFLTSFVFDPVKAQSSTSRVGMLQLERAEFDALKALFLSNVDSWLSDPAVAEGRLLVDEDAVLLDAVGDDALTSTTEQDEEQDEEEEEGNHRLALERAKAVAHRAVADCARQRERASTAFSRIQAADRVLKKEPVLLPSEDVAILADVPDTLRRAHANLLKAESLCTQLASQSLGRSVATLRRFQSLARLGLPCAVWADSLGDFLKRVSGSATTSSSSSTASLGSSGGLAPGEISAQDVGSLEGFKAVVQSILDTVGELKATDPRTLTVVQKLERAQRKVQEFVGLADAVIVIAQAAADDCAAARAAARNLRKAFLRRAGPNLQPVLRQACETAPDCGDFLSVCLQLRLKDRIAALTRYQELAGMPGGLRPNRLGQAARLLEEAVQAASLLEYDSSSSLSAASSSHVEKAEQQAKQANARVRMRVEDPADVDKLVAQLIEQATSEKNLSEMWIGWMPFI